MTQKAASRRVSPRRSPRSEVAWLRTGSAGSPEQPDAAGGMPGARTGGERCQIETELSDNPATIECFGRKRLGGSFARAESSQNYGFAGFGFDLTPRGTPRCGNAKTLDPRRPHWMRIHVLRSFNDWNLSAFGKIDCLDGPNV